jgi:cytochrome oxidase Cu insertion factor (SCO1/SenC/PrrC family)
VSPKTIDRLKVLGIGAIAVAPVLGSYLLYLFWSPASYTNYGSLLEPRAVPGDAFQQIDGTVFRFADLRGQWVLAAFARGHCSTQCERTLWTIRQVRQAQGKDLTRIERVLVLDDGVEPSEAIKRDYAGTRFVRAPVDALRPAFPAPTSQRGYVYLIDPQGYVIMRYAEESDPKGMIKDIARLLKYSRTG